MWNLLKGNLRRSMTFTYTLAVHDGSVMWRSWSGELTPFSEFQYFFFNFSSEVEYSVEPSTMDAYGDLAESSVKNISEYLETFSQMALDINGEL